MKRVRSHHERINDKSSLSGLSLRLQKEYALSVVEARTLTEDIHEFLTQNKKDFLSEGQVLYTAVVKTEPPGKALRLCERKQIKLTVYPTDLIALSFTNHQKYNREMVSRLCWEAIQQGCVLTQEDLARLLHCSLSTIKRIISVYRKQDFLIPTRGNYNDIGPGVSHKAQAVKLFLRGLTLLDISKRMAHSIYSIERYIDDFTLVYSAYVNEQYSALRISRMMAISPKLVKDYIALYEEVKNNPDYSYQLQQIAIRARYLYTRSKKKTTKGRE